MSDFDQAKEPLDLSGCPYVSEDHQQFACWNVELEMGFGALSLDFYSRATPGKYARVDIFGRGDNDDDWTKRDQNIT